MGRMKDLKIEIEEGVYELENLESELASINYELKSLEDRKKDVKKTLEILRAKFGSYKTLSLSQERRGLKF
jgi:predicted  nucleic acid-binding Zn-ribbon protein